MGKLNLKKSKNYFVAVVVVLLVAIIGLMVARNWPIAIRFEEEGKLVEPQKGWYESYLSFSERLVDWETRLQALEAQDNFGGATPEETLKAFVEALKAGDTELASRYFVFNKQVQMAKELAIGKENNNLDFLVNYIKKVDDGEEIRKGLFRFTVIENNLAVMSFDLSFNENTKVWKIESL